MGVGFVRCIRNNSGRLSTPILYCRAGVVFNSPTSTPSFIHGSKSPILHSLLSFGLTHSSSRHHQSFVFSKDQYRLPSPPIVDLILNSPRISAAVRFRVSEYLKSSAYGLWEVNGKLHISCPHAFLVGPVQGGQGTRLHVSHSQRHSTQWYPCGHFVRNVLVLDGVGANGSYRTTDHQARQAPKNLNSSDFLQASATLQDPFYTSFRWLCQGSSLLAWS